jgi:hypothetical protein
MQEEEIQPSKPKSLQARFDRPPQYPFDLVRGLLAEVAFAGHTYAGREPAAKAKGCSDHFLGSAVAIARREVKQVDAGSDGCVHGRDAFVERCRAPQHAKPAAAQR